MHEKLQTSTGLGLVSGISIWHSCGFCQVVLCAYLRLLFCYQFMIQDVLPELDGSCRSSVESIIQYLESTEIALIYSIKILGDMSELINTWNLLRRYFACWHKNCLELGTYTGCMVFHIMDCNKSLVKIDYCWKEYKAFTSKGDSLSYVACYHLCLKMRSLCWSWNTLLICISYWHRPEFTDKSSCSRYQIVYRQVQPIENWR